MQISSLATKLWPLVLQGGRIHEDELKATLKTSKKALRQALDELEEAGLITIMYMED